MSDGRIQRTDGGVSGTDFAFIARHGEQQNKPGARQENTAAALHSSTGASRAGRLVRTNRVRRLSAQPAGMSAQPMAPVRNKGLATAPPRMSTRFPTLMGPILRPSLTVWTTDRSRSAAIAARFSTRGVVWAPKRKHPSERRPEARRGRLSSGRQAFHPGWPISASRAL